MATAAPPGNGRPTSTLAASLLTHTSPHYTFTFTPFLQRTYQHTLATDRPAGTTTTTNPPNNPREGGGHGGGFGSLVCKHWLRGLCKKGETCEFLHEYNLRKMPECNFFVRNGYCSNGDECLYLHIDPSSRLPPCPHYERGFCPLGGRCDKKHVRRRLCVYYLAGFCPDGRECRLGAHPRWVREGELEKPRVREERKEEAGAQEEREREVQREREREMERGRDGGRDGERGHDGRHKDRFGGGRGGRWRGKRGGFRGRGGN